MKKRVSKSLRLFEVTLWVLGISLLGAAFGDTLDRYQYQEQQERALFQGGPASSVLTVESEPLQSEPLPPPVSAATPEPPRSEPPAAPVSRRAAPRPDPSALGRLEIPRIGMSAIVKEGGDEKTLSRAVGLVPGSPHPGDDGNVILAGHRDTFFRPLRKIKIGDRIRFALPSETYEYEVKTVMVVDPSDTAVLQSKGIDELTLVTCYPFRFVGTAPDRFIVNAVRVN